MKLPINMSYSQIIDFVNAKPAELSLDEWIETAFTVVGNTPIEEPMCVPEEESCFELAEEDITADTSIDDQFYKENGLLAPLSEEPQLIESPQPLQLEIPNQTGEEKPIGKFIILLLLTFY